MRLGLLLLLSLSARAEIWIEGKPAPAALIESEEARVEREAEELRARLPLRRRSRERAFRASVGAGWSDRGAAVALEGAWAPFALIELRAGGHRSADARGSASGFSVEARGRVPLAKTIHWEGGFGYGSERTTRATESAGAWGIVGSLGLSAALTPGWRVWSDMALSLGAGGAPRARFDRVRLGSAWKLADTHAVEARFERLRVAAGPELRTHQVLAAWHVVF